MSKLLSADIPKLESDLLQTNRLEKWLKWEGYSPLLFGGGFFIPVGLIAVGLTVGALLFTPFLLMSLYRLRRRSWIVAFLLFVVAPAALVLLIGPRAGRLFLAIAVGLIPFYLFTWILKMAVAEWRHNLRWTLEMSTTTGQDSGMD